MSFEDRGHVSKNSHKVNIEDGVNQLSLTEERPIKKVVHNETIGLFVVNEHPELTKARARGWYLLARCTVHVCNSRDMFVDYQPVTGHEVVLEDNSHVDVVGFGTVKLQLDTGKVLTLENVFHIPEITMCLISVAKLTDMDFNVTFRGKKCVINDGLEKVVHDETIGFLVSDEHPELTKARARGWYLLTRCTVHVCNSSDMFVDYKPVTGHEVVLEDNSRVDVVGFGTVKLQLDTGKVLTLDNVFHIPEITKCLISVAKLTDMDFNVTFRSKKCVIDDGLEVVGKGYREDELYRLSLMGECPAKKVVLQDTDTTRKCNVCGEIGHCAQECKDKKSDCAKVVLKAIIGFGTRSKQKAQGWYLNCGSSEHVCYSRDMFVDYNPMRDHEVILDNDDHLDVAGIGTVVIRFDTDKVLTLSNVLHIPKISKCYVSVAKLDDLGYFITFVDGIGVITKSQEVIAKGYNVGNSVYQLSLTGMYGDMIVQKGYKDDVLYKMDFTKEPPKVPKLKIQLTIGLLMGDEHPELTKARARGWYLLPRCTMHVCNSRDMFVDYQPVTGHEAVLEDDSRVAVDGMGFSMGFDAEECYVKKGDQIVGNVFVEGGLVRLGVIDEHSGGNQAIQCHYYGRFNDAPKKEYIEGEICFVDMINRKDFKDDILNSVMQSLGYEMDDEVLFYYKIPLKSLDTGLKPLLSERNYKSFLWYVQKHKVMQVYVELVEKDEEYDSDSDSDSDSGSENKIVDKEHVVDEVEVLDFDSLESDLDDVPENDKSLGLRKLKKKQSSFKFFIGREFANRDLAKDLIRTHVVESMRNLDFLRNDKRRIRVVCNGVVPSKNVIIDKVQRLIVDIYGKGKLVNKDAKEDKSRCPWCNPDTTVKIDVYGEEDPKTPTRMFRRIYVYLGALKRGFRECGRELLGRAHCDLLINNVCEVFNRQLLDARDSPIITALEFVREYLMKRIVIVQKVIQKCDGPLTPAVAKLFAKIKDASTGKWETSGIPCKQAIATIHDMTDNGFDLGIHEDWVHDSYKLQTWMNVYSYKVNPVNGKDMWSEFDCPTTLLPPKVHPQIGRPPKKRKKSKGKIVMVNGIELTRKGKTVTCSLCHAAGHNKRSCSQASTQASQRNESVPKKTTRTKRTTSVTGTRITAVKVGTQASTQASTGSTFKRTKKSASRHS
nr:transposase, mutator type [Tanacetum cinerariifolium]